MEVSQVTVTSYRNFFYQMRQFEAKTAYI